MTPYKYKKKMCTGLTAWMAKGYSYITWGPSQSPTISVSAQYQWEKDHPEWLEAKKEGYALGLKFFESLLVSAAVGVVPKQLKDMGSKKIDMSAVIFALKTRFHREYGEISKIDNTTKGEIKIVVDSDDMKL